MSKSVTQSEEEMKQRLIDSLKDIEWDIMQGKIDNREDEIGGSAETY